MLAYFIDILIMLTLHKDYFYMLSGSCFNFIHIFSFPRHFMFLYPFFLPITFFFNLLKCVPLIFYL